jgi:hypothetical protein
MSYKIEIEIIQPIEVKTNNYYEWVHYLAKNMKPFYIVSDTNGIILGMFYEELHSKAFYNLLTGEITK